MKLLTFFTLVLYVASQEELNTTNICLLNNKFPLKPFPSLLTCYKYNTESCCSPVHDFFIRDSLRNLLTSNCLRKYSDLENLFCIACDPKEDTFIDHVKKEVRLCETFINLLFERTDPTKIKMSSTYDNCGFKIVEDLEERAKGLDVIVPSMFFNDIFDFLDSVGVPFLRGYKFKSVSPSEELSGVTCYLRVEFLGWSVVALLLAIYL